MVQHIAIHQGGRGYFDEPRGANGGPRGIYCWRLDLIWVNSYLFAFKSDSSNVLVLFGNPSQATKQFQNIIRECKHIFGQDIRWLLSYIRRSGNEKANLLARMATYYGLHFAFDRRLQGS